MKNALISSVSALSLSLAASAVMADGGPLKVGVLATLEGTYTALGEDGLRGVRTAMAEANSKAGGRDIELVVQSTDTSPDSAVRGARKLVEPGRCRNCHWSAVWIRRHRHSRLF